MGTPRRLTRPVAARHHLDLFVDLGISPGTVLQRDDTMMTCMHQRHGLCTSGDENEDMISPSDAAVGDTELGHTLHIGPEVVVAVERLNCAGLQSGIQLRKHRVLACPLRDSGHGEWWSREGVEQKHRPWRGRFLDLLQEGKLAEGVCILVSLAGSILKLLVVCGQADAPIHHAGRQNLGDRLGGVQDSQDRLVVGMEGDLAACDELVEIL